MIIDLAKLGNGFKAATADLEPEAIALDAVGAAIDGPVHFVGEIERSDGKTRVRGTITADMTLDCTRCLTPINRELDLPFEAVFVETPEEGKGDKELVDFELVESPVSGDSLNIADVIREQILLDLPEQVFCKDDCKGLCPQCGANLNLIDCKCENDEIDPRWEALRNLK
jgi:DUF177 domain-containing protein